MAINFILSWYHSEQRMHRTEFYSEVEVYFKIKHIIKSGYVNICLKRFLFRRIWHVEMLCRHCFSAFL